jgi:hypothetical protein
MPGDTESSYRNLRFYRSLIAPAALLFVWFALVSFVISRAGIAIGLISGTCFVLGLLLLYWHIADMLNLRVIRTRKAKSELRNGDVVAFDGMVSVLGEPLQSPFTAQPCAAYTYRIFASRGARSHRRNSIVVLAEGFHMAKCKVENSNRSLRLCNFPGFEDDLRQLAQGSEWLTEARDLMTQLATTATSAGQRERQGTLLDVRHKEVEEVHRDYCMETDLGTGANLHYREEVLPVNRNMCFIGTYDEEREGLTARKRRWGHNLIVYRGNAQEVLARVGKESRFFNMAAAVLVGVGVLGVVYALLR